MRTMRQAVLLGTLILAGGMALTLAQHTSPDVMKKLTEALAGSISSEDVREFALCHLRAAYWGAYDLKVRIGAQATADGKARSFEWTKGGVREQLDPDSSVTMAAVEGGGAIVFRTKEEAFAKGVPFFLADAVMVSPTELHYTVHSNPNFGIHRAVAWYESRGVGLFGVCSECVRFFPKSIYIYT